jgi:hypothetical protein
MPQLGSGAVLLKENAMSVSSNAGIYRYASRPFDNEVSVHDLLNDTTEWLQYARGLTGLLAELVHEADAIDCGRMALGLEAIGAMTQVGIKCAAEAHAQLTWQENRKGNSPLTGDC